MKAIPFCLFLFCCILFQSNAQTQKKPNPVLVELFTSEGCSSCSPADDVMIELQNVYEDSKKPVYFIAYHVDYWNYLGWKDQFSSSENTQRQQDYSQIFKQRGVYTPQAVINGKKEMVGSKRQLLKESIDMELASPNSDQLTMKAAYEPNSNKISISYNYSGSNADKQIHFVLLERQKSVKVTKGENAGSTVKHIHIVKQEELARLKAQGNEVFVVKDKISIADYKFIAFVQSIANKNIVAVAEGF